MPFVCSVHPRSFEDLGRDALEAGRKDDHGEPGPHPDAHEDEREVIDLDRVGQTVRAGVCEGRLWSPRILEPARRLTTDLLQNSVNGADTRIEFVHEPPNYGRRHERDRHWDKDRGLDDRLVAHARGKHRDYQTESHRNDGEDGEPHEVVEECRMRVGDKRLRIIDDEPVVIEGEAEERVGAFGKEAPSNGVDSGIEEENPGKQQGGRQPEPGHPPFSADHLTTHKAQPACNGAGTGSRPGRLFSSHVAAGYGLAPAGKAASMFCKISSRSPTAPSERT